MQVKLYDREFDEFYYVEREYSRDEIVITFDTVERGNDDYHFNVCLQKRYIDDGWCHGVDTHYYMMSFEELVEFLEKKHCNTHVFDVIYTGMSAVVDAKEGDFIDMMKITLEKGFGNYYNLTKAQWVYFDDFTEYTNIPQ